MGIATKRKKLEKTKQRCRSKISDEVSKAKLG